MGKRKRIENLGQISEEEAGKIAESRLRKLVQDSSKEITSPWLEGIS